MTPRESVGRAFFVGEPQKPLRISVEPRDRLSVVLDRHLGVKGDTMARVCEADCFSSRVQTRLWLQHRHDAELHRDYTLRPAESLEGVYEECKALTGLTGRAAEAQASTDFANLLGNTLGRRLLAAYAAADYGEFSIARPGTAKTLREQRVVAMDGAVDVPSVDPETSNYTELPTLAERVMSFAMQQRGVIVTISRKTIINDDVGAVQRLIDELGRSARRTLARAVWAPWIANATYGADSVAWFHATHNNLQSTALSETEVIAAVRKLLDQTQPGNSEKMGTRPRAGSLWLVVPNALWDAALKLNQTTASALYHLFGVHNEFVVVNPLLTDSSDWGVHRDAREVESIRVDFLNGREEPEFILADNPEDSAQMFIGDRASYKLRHEYGVALAEFRGAVKAVVA